MNIEEKILIDYETLFTKHELLTCFHDCLLMIPFSSFTLFHNMVNEGLENGPYTDEEKNDFLEFYMPFIDVVLNNPQIIDEIKNQNKKQSSTICLNERDNLHVCFTGSFKNDSLLFSEDTLKNLDIFNFDVLNACIYFDCPLFSSNEELAKIIERDALKIEYVVPVVEDSEED